MKSLLPRRVWTDEEHLIKVTHRACGILRDFIQKSQTPAFIKTTDKVGVGALPITFHPLWDEVIFPAISFINALSYSLFRQQGISGGSFPSPTNILPISCTVSPLLKPRVNFSSSLPYYVAAILVRLPLASFPTYVHKSYLF